MNITNDLVTEYIQSFYKPSSNQLEELRKEAEVNKVPIILKETEDFLKTILLYRQPKNILEIGAAVGYSSSFFATICPDAKIVTIEKDEDVYKKAIDNINKLGFSDRITVKQGDAEEVTYNLKEEGFGPFDLIFIDAAKSHYKRFLDAALTNCANNGLIVSDNVLLKARTASDIYDPRGKHKTNIRKMREYVEYIFNHHQLETSLVSCGDGLSLSIFRGENE